MKSDCNGKHARKEKLSAVTPLTWHSQENTRLPSASSRYSASSAASLTSSSSPSSNTIRNKAAAAGLFWQNSNFQWWLEDSFPQLTPLSLCFIFPFSSPPYTEHHGNLCFSFSPLLSPALFELQDNLSCHKWSGAGRRSQVSPSGADPVQGSAVGRKKLKVMFVFLDSLHHNRVLTAQAFAALALLQDVLRLHLVSLSFPCFGSSRDTTYWVPNWLLQDPRKFRRRSGVTIPHSPNGCPVNLSKAASTAAANIPYLLWDPPLPTKRAGSHVQAPP